MAKWYPNLKKKEKGQVFYSDRGHRFFTAFEMASTKRHDSIHNSRVKRGSPFLTEYVHTVCKCGAEDCIFIVNNSQKNYKIIVASLEKERDERIALEKYEKNAKNRKRIKSKKIKL